MRRVWWLASLLVLAQDREDPTRPPCLTVFPPGREIEVRVSGSEVRLWKNGARESEPVPVRNGIARLPAGKEGDVYQYSDGGERVTLFVTSCPTDLTKVSLKPVGRVHPSPADWSEQVFYMVVLDRFADGDPSNNTLGYSNYDPRDPFGVHGGDFKGLQSKLDYLKGLGVTAIWVSPIVQNWYAYHGYHAVNFMMPDRRLGTMAELRELVDEAHRRGMYVLLDVVCNHQADLIYETDGDHRYRESGHPIEFLYRGKKQKVLPLPVQFRDLRLYHNYGEIDAWDDFDRTPCHSQTGNFPGGLDDFKTTLPEVREWFSTIYKWWIAQADFDGFRFDTAKHVDPGFLEHFCREIRQYAASIGKKSFFLLGEVFSGNDRFCSKYAPPFDGVTQFSFYHLCDEVFRKGKGVEEIGRWFENAKLYRTPEKNLLFIDNHDVPRFLNNLRDPRAIRPALALMLLGPAIPCIYYGTEQGFSGGGDPHNREDMFNRFDAGHELYGFISRIAKLRRRASVRPLHQDTGPGVFVFERGDLVVAINSSPDERSVRDLPVGRELEGVVDAPGRPAAGGRVTLVLPGYGVQVYRYR